MHKPNLTLNPSFSLTGMLVLIYSLGIASIIDCNILLTAKIFLIIGLSIFLGYDLYRYTFHQEIVKLWQISENEWCIQQRNGNTLTGKFGKRLLLTNWLVILRLELIHKSRIIVLMPDMLKAGELRHLKLYISTS